MKKFSDQSHAGQIGTLLTIIGLIFGGAGSFMLWAADSRSGPASWNTEKGRSGEIHI